jgi:hypothetical protein
MKRPGLQSGRWAVPLLPGGGPFEMWAAEPVCLARVMTNVAHGAVLRSGSSNAP